MAIEGWNYQVGLVDRKDKVYQPFVNEDAALGYAQSLSKSMVEIVGVWDKGGALAWVFYLGTKFRRES